MLRDEVAELPDPGVRLELGAVAAGKLLRPRGVVVVPFAQLRGRGDVLDPGVDLGRGFLDAPRPDPVDEDAVGATGDGVVDPGNVDVHRALLTPILRRPTRPCPPPPAQSPPPPARVHPGRAKNGHNQTRKT